MDRMELLFHPDPWEPPMSSLIRRLSRPARLAVALGALIAVTAGIGVATGAIPDGNGAVTACYTNSGDVRFIDTAKSQKCKSSEGKVVINQKGQPGAPGAPGADGAPGA